MCENAQLEKGYQGVGGGGGFRNLLADRKYYTVQDPKTYGIRRRMQWEPERLECFAVLLFFWLWKAAKAKDNGCCNL